MSKTALYARVSTDQQATGLESQVRILKDYCTKNDIINYELFTDEGISGTKSSRPALDRMITAVNNGEISSVVVYSFSRFARSTTHLLNALQIFKANNVAFVSITEKIDTSTPVGIAVFSILAAISQLERDLIADAIKKCRCSRKDDFFESPVKLFLPRKSLTTGEHLHGKLYRTRCP